MKTQSKLKILFFSATMLAIMGAIGWIFWTQEIQYSLPTPVPANFVDVKVGDTIDLKGEINIKKNNFALLHFFNFDCACSRFNMKEFERLAHLHKDSIDFFVVVQSEDSDAAERFQRKYELDIPVIVDSKGSISDKCGIYATPQAVILNRNSTLYFKGNYNKARFCTKKETRFVEIALDYLMKEEPLPLFMQYAVSEPYGCTLPSDETHSELTALF
jgi:hypothetical protein